MGSLSPIEEKLPTKERRENGIPFTASASSGRAKRFAYFVRLIEPRSVGREVYQTPHWFPAIPLSGV